MQRMRQEIRGNKQLKMKKFQCHKPAAGNNRLHQTGTGRANHAGNSDQATTSQLDESSVGDENNVQMDPVSESGQGEPNDQMQKAATEDDGPFIEVGKRVKL